MLSRNTELDVLFEKIYEDNLAEKISDEHFAKMCIGSFNISKWDKTPGLAVYIETRKGITLSYAT